MFGGFVNCFDNCGKQLMSYDKYTWSQGRFLWLFSRLACTPAPMFNQTERQEFLRLARQDAAFLMEHCLLAPDDWRCTFLMERERIPLRKSCISRRSTASARAIIERFRIRSPRSTAHMAFR